MFKQQQKDLNVYLSPNKEAVVWVFIFDLKRNMKTSSKSTGQVSVPMFVALE